MAQVHVLKGAAVVTLKDLRRRLADYLKTTRVERAVIFGSFARGDADFASDLDLVLVEPTPLPFLERGRSHLPLFRLGVGVDLLIYTPEEFEQLRRSGNPLIERVEREGVTVYARSDR